MTTTEIKNALLEGTQFENEAADWYSIINVKAERFILNIGGEMKFYKNIDSVSKRICSLLKRGY